VWQALNDEFAAHDVYIVAVGIDVDPTKCFPYIDKAPELSAAGLSLIDVHHQTVGALGFRNVPMSMWVNEDGTIALPAHHSPVKAGWGDRAMPEGLPPRIEGRFIELKKAVDRHQEYLAALRLWVQTGAAPAPIEDGFTHDQAQAVAAFELGDHYRVAGNEAGQVQWWREAHRLDPDNWSAKRQAWTLITTPEGAAPDLIQEDTGPYEGNWLDDVVERGMGNYYPATPW
jgi:hypothetical protein